MRNKVEQGKSPEERTVREYEIAKASFSLLSTSLLENLRVAPQTNIISPGLSQKVINSCGDQLFGTLNSKSRRILKNAQLAKQHEGAKRHIGPDSEHPARLKENSLSGPTRLLREEISLMEGHRA